MVWSCEMEAKSHVMCVAVSTTCCSDTPLFFKVIYALLSSIIRSCCLLLSSLSCNLNAKLRNKFANNSLLQLFLCFSHYRTHDFAVLIPILLASQTKGWVYYRWGSGVKLLHDWKNSSKRCEFLGFYCYLCHVISEFCLFLICNTKIGEISDMTKSWATFCCSGA